jgi:hypothetical protein
MEQSELMRLVVRAFESLDIPYMITGSLASSYYGELFAYSEDTGHITFE